MKRALQLFGLILMVLLACSRPAEANMDWWDWLEDLSGPGSFNSRLPGNLIATIICSDSKEKTKAESLFKLSDPTKPGTGTCLFIDYRFFRAEEDKRFYRVDASVVEFGPSVRLHPAVELGAGVGWIHFSSKAPDRSPVTTTRFTISLPRLVFMPFLAIPQLQKNNNWGFFKIYMRETLIKGDLTQGDFAAKPGTEFSAKHEHVRSMGFIIDATAAGHLVKDLF